MPGAEECNMAVEQTHVAGRELPTSPVTSTWRKSISEASLLLLGQLYSTLTMAMHIIKFLTSQTYQGQADHVSNLYAYTV